ncbi:class I SAM-dependent methyltransferase [Bacillus spizizenii]|uniref:hypothetical protein n=1 Tax=Bacillus spizizenii TaxID=96241 RepID=UPI002DBA2979|nr:hypothetical protein [Bacillus spizizenii]MEC1529839.1 hypothetical protein [Bacillus spizizenii]
MKQMNSYIDSVFSNEDDLLEEVVSSIKENGMPSISVSPSAGKLLTMLVSISGAKHVLEIGALGGYSGWVLSAVETVFQCLAEDKDVTKIGFFLNPEAKQMKKDLAVVLKDNLEAEQRLGYFHSELDMETVAECLIGMIEHLTDSFLLTGIKDPASLAAQVVNLLIYGMLPKGSDVR